MRVMRLPCPRQCAPVTCVYQTRQIVPLGTRQQQHPFAPVSLALLLLGASPAYYYSS